MLSALDSQLLCLPASCFPLPARQAEQCMASPGGTALREASTSSFHVADTGPQVAQVAQVGLYPHHLASTIQGGALVAWPSRTRQHKSHSQCHQEDSAVPLPFTATVTCPAPLPTSPPAGPAHRWSSKPLTAILTEQASVYQYSGCCWGQGCVFWVLPGLWLALRGVGPATTC